MTLSLAHVEPFLWRLKGSLLSAGVPITDLETDHLWAACQAPTVVLGERPLGVGVTFYHFYPTMLHWKLHSAKRFTAWLPPDINKDGGIPFERLDRTIPRFIALIRQSMFVKNAPSGEQSCMRLIVRND